ncbi:lipopolysaccharide transport protein [Wigglesworthia glossinidia endosymbiont of Glossina morsitans morsitans (Yale colony)]|uniref:Lipopolysaccharide transport protein n=1 Tax=Wigglesworthia glossinidia endosymbiont of Glossina morsitans morsitans (Yale colony) TaxID=1142511 RepID=H6Q4Z1_WIGGL|nr:LPS export ABC transporter periplasmic protein LptC [Wigglesworthia glossinidia]AFA41274.1 lipopolysaccharide transport protein [Wigglesworthia glossinidia endosymbiont of Glossina morsitans morsitans (Yale colony)]
MKQFRFHKIRILFFLIVPIIFIAIPKRSLCALYYMQLKSPLNYSNLSINQIYGGLKYSISAQNMHFLSQNEYIFFSYPIITIFDDHHIPMWIIESIRAYLSKDYLNLSGNVQIKNFFYHTYIKRLLTENFKINLRTQDFISKKKTILYGLYFCSVGINMQGNLKNKIITLNQNTTIFHEK